MGLLDWLLRRKKPETEMPAMGQKTEERQIQPQESKDTQATKDLKEFPTVAKQVSEQREIVIEGKEGAAPSSQAEVEPAEVGVPVEATRVEKTTIQEEAQPEMSAKEYVSEGVEVYQKGDYQDALSKFKVATELDPTLAAAWSNMGCALGQLGDCDGALEAFATALDIDPENQQAKEGKELCLKMVKRNIST